MRDRISTLASIADCGAIVAPLLPPATALAFSGGWGPEDGAQSWLPYARSLHHLPTAPVNAQQTPLLCPTCAGRYERTCRSVLSFAQVSLGVLLPTLVSARWWRPNQARQPAAAGSRSSTSAAAAPKHAHLWCWAAAVRSRADDAMHTAMQCGDSALAAGIAYWWILSLLWMACSGPVRAP